MFKISSKMYVVYSIQHKAIKLERYLHGVFNKFPDFFVQALRIVVDC